MLAVVWRVKEGGCCGEARCRCKFEKQLRNITVGHRCLGVATLNSKLQQLQLYNVSHVPGSASAYTAR